MKKLIQTGVDNEGVFNVMDGLSFARAMNENADELSTETKLDLEVHNTPEALAKAFKEQAGKIGFHTPGGPDDLPTFEEEGAPIDSPSELAGGVAQIYNEAIEGDDPEPEPEPELPTITLVNPLNLDPNLGETCTVEDADDIAGLIEQAGEGEIDVLVKQVGNEVSYECKLSATSGDSADVVNEDDELLTISIETDDITSESIVIAQIESGYSGIIVNR